MNRFRAGAVLLCCVLIGACATKPATTALPGDVQAILDLPQYAHGSWSWDAVELGSGKTLYARGENKLNFLGSTTKLFTVGTYYEEFGPDSTLETPVYATGTRSPDALTGDLVLVGSGDFILGSRGVLDGQLQYTEPDHVYAYAIPTVKPVAANPLAGLDKLAAQVRAAGIAKIDGDVLVDDRLWDPFMTKEGVVTSIMVNDNLLDVLVNPGAKAGDPVAVDTIPKTDFFTIDNQATTAAGGGQSTLSASLGADNRVVITGQLPAGAQQQDLAQFAPSPAAYARALFIEALRRAGVTVDAPLQAPAGALPPDSDYPAAEKVASLTSPPTSILTKLVTKISDNRGAETLLCLLAKRAGSKDCDSGGMPVIISKFAKAKIDPGTVNIYDGEGSDPASATPAAMTRWLTYIHGQPFAALFKAGLPDIDHNGKIMVKSGLSARPQMGSMPAMFVAAGQAGYLTTASGKDAVVAVYALNATYSTVAEGLDQDLPNTEKVLNQFQRAG
ncbi:D-alanyl-D-alanine carboxypeptidase/D-alanyl-D-alanine endopeptidase [Mycobacterium szulgai]|uniref:D-alanyl-D-alanine carboxypeptidase/D-alanyl-D-alanine endopeptidase n=1 Tax=Mycobacterium szulgai TaxID=1787 RepID=UPI0021F2B741|nr:D-alanyl-D-alanine carboxypeptidase/D-alanyl-D-alanine-endopeptidase [Mycobacterium szulgai]MCV7076256.1 D-alanyl-D-alanine carboxypeptidase/D-alanyl-D-alanine-endopeptidase [Mycobacterium szulgai]